MHGQTLSINCWLFLHLREILSSLQVFLQGFLVDIEELVFTPLVLRFQINQRSGRSFPGHQFLKHGVKQFVQ